MSKPMNEQWIDQHLSDLIDGDSIVLEETRYSGGLVRTSVNKNRFIEMFGDVDVEPNANAAAARDRLKDRDVVRINPETGEEDPNGEEVERGYSRFFDKWEQEGRFT